METKEEKQLRINRTMDKIQKILNEENCELEPFVLIISGQLVKKEINVIAKDLPVVNPSGSSTIPTNPVEGGS